MTMWVGPISREIILGRDWMEKSKVRMTCELSGLKTNPIPGWMKEVEEICQEQEKRELPESRGEFDHVIELTQETISSSSLILTRSEEQEIIKTYLDDMLKKGWIRPSKSLMRAALFLVPKKGGRRPVIDYRKLNSVIITDSTLLSLIQDTLDQLGKAKYFSKFDMKDAFNQIRIRKSDEWKTAFRTRYGTFEYLVMSFELVNAPGTFQRFANHVLREELDQGTMVYMDDIFVIRNTQ